MISPQRIRGGAQEQGFVLVGVVMFVLALTILGLSLFALSSYEGQFVGQASSSTAALDVAMSGVEHAKFVLARTRLMQNVGTLLFPTPGVIYARARADSDSVSSIDTIPLDVPITIRVLADVGGERRMVEAQYNRQDPAQLYKRLMTVSDSMVTQINPPPPLAGLTCGHYSFNGEVWEGGGAGPGWISCVTPPPNFSAHTASLPTPDVVSYFAQHSGVPVNVPLNPGNPPVNVDLTGGGFSPPQVNYFTTDNEDPPDPPTRPGGQCSLYIGSTNNHTIQVKGWVVWMLPKGLRAEGRLTVVGTTNDCLVIVAGKSADDDHPQLAPGQPLMGLHYGFLGITFSSAIQSDNVPVILVTDGWLYNEHFQSPMPITNSHVGYLSVFARSASYWGPYIGAMSLEHTPGDARDLPGGLIDQLCNQDALPNVGNGAMTFKSVPGSWRELVPPSN